MASRTWRLDLLMRLWGASALGCRHHNGSGCRPETRRNEMQMGLCVKCTAINARMNPRKREAQRWPRDGLVRGVGETRGCRKRPGALMMGAQQGDKRVMRELAAGWRFSLSHILCLPPPTNCRRLSLCLPPLLPSSPRPALALALYCSHCSQLPSSDSLPALPVLEKPSRSSFLRSLNPPCLCPRQRRTVTRQ